MAKYSPNTYAGLPCPERPRKISVAGLAYHPYAETPAKVFESIAALEKHMDNAASKGRISVGRRIYLTEHGFLTHGLVPSRATTGLGAPDNAVTPNEQAIFDNRVVRNAYEDPRVRSVAQFLLRDQGDGGWESGLKFNDVLNPSNPLRDAPKPAYHAYQLAIDVIQRGDMVEVFGLARACKYGFTIEARSIVDGEFREVVAVDTDELGYGKKLLPAIGRKEWRLSCGLDTRSRVALARSL